MPAMRHQPSPAAAVGTFRKKSDEMMDEWRRGMPTPHLATTIPHYHGLDFGRTMPLRHPPATAHARPNINSSPQSFLPFSHPLGHPLPIPVASRKLSISPSSSSLSSTHIQVPTNESSARIQNVEKKRWQTANYRCYDEIHDQQQDRCLKN